MKNIYEKNYNQAFDSNQLNPHDDQMKDHQKENSHCLCSSICIISFLLFLTIILLIIAVLVFLFILKPKYDTQIETLKEEIKNLKGEINQETIRLNKMLSRGMIIAWYGEKD